MTQIKNIQFIRDIRAGVKKHHALQKKMERAAAIEDAVTIYDIIDLLEGATHSINEECKTLESIKLLKQDYLIEIANVYIKSKSAIVKYEKQKNRKIDSKNGKFQNLISELKDEQNKRSNK